MWNLILVFLSCLILPQSSVCVESKDILKRLQHLENKVSAQESVIEELHKTTTTLRDTNAELCETNAELQETNADLRATNADLQDTNLQLRETISELHKTYTELGGTNTDQRARNGSLVIEPAKRFVLNNEGPVAFTAAILPLVIDHLQDRDTIKFETVITDIGGGYNNQSGMFVVPVTGIYMFSCSLMDHWEAQGVMIHAEIVQNQRVLGRIFAHAEPDKYRDQGAQTVFTHANQGDQIWVRTIDNQNLGLGGELYSTFSGYLLLAM